MFCICIVHGYDGRPRGDSKNFESQSNLGGQRQSIRTRLLAQF